MSKLWWPSWYCGGLPAPYRLSTSYILHNFRCLVNGKDCFCLTKKGKYQKRPKLCYFDPEQTDTASDSGI